MCELAATIEEVIRDRPGHVELAVFGSRDPRAIAAAVDALCRRHLGQRIDSWTFYRSSIASVHGLVLANGDHVVAKGHQPDVPRTHLEAVTSIQRRLAADGFPCPRPLTDPLPLALGIATVEEELTRGRWHDGHDPTFRGAMAQSLAELVGRCRSIGPSGQGLQLDRFLSIPAAMLWPTPHARLFDFEVTAVGAERIDQVATAARTELADLGGKEEVIGHTDWRAENLRFDGAAISAVYDWQSLVRTVEPALVGGVAHAFCADWHEPASEPQAPSVDEARAFVAEYEDARGATFGLDERRLIGAGYAYATAYTARCGHAIDPDGANEPSEGFRTLIQDHGTHLIESFRA